MMQEILFSIEDQVGILQVNRPQARNGLNWTAQAEFAGIIQSVAHDPAIRVLIITGTGDKAFVAGGDLRELAGEVGNGGTSIRLKQTMTRALQQLSELPIPTIAAINGDAIGGGFEILTACDLRIAMPHVQLRMAQVGVGLTTGWGGTARLVNLLGQSRATDLLLTSRSLTALEAQAIGLVHRLASQNVLAEAKAWAQELVVLPREAMAATKMLLTAANRMTPNEMAALETLHFTKLFGKANHREALTAFVEKRKPLFNQQ
jgi:enoyl-CoA hydratase